MSLPPRRPNYLPVKRTWENASDTESSPSGTIFKTPPTGPATYSSSPPPPQDFQHFGHSSTSNPMRSVSPNRGNAFEDDLSFQFSDRLGQFDHLEMPPNTSPCASHSSSPPRDLQQQSHIGHSSASSPMRSVSPNRGNAFEDDLSAQFSNRLGHSKMPPNTSPCPPRSPIDEADVNDYFFPIANQARDVEYQNQDTQDTYFNPLTMSGAINYDPSSSMPQQHMAAPTSPAPSYSPNPMGTRLGTGMGTTNLGAQDQNGRYIPQQPMPSPLPPTSTSFHNPLGGATSYNPAFQMGAESPVDPEQNSRCVPQQQMSPLLSPMSTPFHNPMGSATYNQTNQAGAETNDSIGTGDPHRAAVLNMNTFQGMTSFLYNLRIQFCELDDWQSLGFPANLLQQFLDTCRLSDAQRIGYRIAIYIENHMPRLHQREIERAVSNAAVQPEIDPAQCSAALQPIMQRMLRTNKNSPLHVAFIIQIMETVTQLSLKAFCRKLLTRVTQYQQWLNPDIDDWLAQHGGWGMLIDQLEVEVKNNSVPM